MLAAIYNILLFWKVNRKSSIFILITQPFKEHSLYPFSSLLESYHPTVLAWIWRHDTKETSTTTAAIPTSSGDGNTGSLQYSRVEQHQSNRQLNLIYSFLGYKNITIWRPSPLLKLTHWGAIWRCNSSDSFLKYTHITEDLMCHQVFFVCFKVKTYRGIRNSLPYACKMVCLV